MKVRWFIYLLLSIPVTVYGEDKSTFKSSVLEISNSISTNSFTEVHFTSAYYYDRPGETDHVSQYRNVCSEHKDLHRAKALLTRMTKIAKNDFKLNLNKLFSRYTTSDMQFFRSEINRNYKDNLEKTRLFLLISNELLKYYKKIIEVDGWEDKFRYISSDQNEIIKYKGGAVYHEVGFPFPSSACYMSAVGYGNNNGQLMYTEFDVTLEAWLYSFWHRRYLEGNVGIANTLLNLAVNSLPSVVLENTPTTVKNSDTVSELPIKILKQRPKVTLNYELLRQRRMERKANRKSKTKETKVVPTAMPEPESQLSSFDKQLYYKLENLYKGLTSRHEKIRETETTEFISLSSDLKAKLLRKIFLDHKKLFGGGTGRSYYLLEFLGEIGDVKYEALEAPILEKLNSMLDEVDRDSTIYNTAYYGDALSFYLKSLKYICQDGDLAFDLILRYRKYRKNNRYGSYPLVSAELSALQYSEKPQIITRIPILLREYLKTQNGRVRNRFRSMLDKYNNSGHISDVIAELRKYLEWQQNINNSSNIYSSYTNQEHIKAIKSLLERYKQHIANQNILLPTRETTLENFGSIFIKAQSLTKVPYMNAKTALNRDVKRNFDQLVESGMVTDVTLDSGIEYQIGVLPMELNQTSLYLKVLNGSNRRKMVSGTVSFINAKGYVLKDSDIQEVIMAGSQNYKILGVRIPETYQRIYKVKINLKIMNEVINEEPEFPLYVKLKQQMAEDKKALIEPVN